MKPLISYYGGKQRIASKILPLFPPHSVYCEPFCGGASLFFMKPVPNVTNNDHYREVLNDTNKELINLYQVCREQPEEFIRQLELMPYSKAEHDKSIIVYNKPGDYDDLTRAIYLFVNISQGFSNCINRGWSRSKYGHTHTSAWSKKVKMLPEILKRLKNVYLDDIDALKCIKTWDSPQTLFYIDPPYPNAHQGHYSGYTQQDFKNLIDLLHTIKGSFVLSNYPNEAVPKEWDCHIINASSSAAKHICGKTDYKRERTECVWVVDKSENVRKELIPVLAKNQASFLSQLQTGT